jgi:hypothetical protein
MLAGGIRKHRAFEDGEILVARCESVDHPGPVIVASTPPSLKMINVQRDARARRKQLAIRRIDVSGEHAFYDVSRFQFRNLDRT